jgi:hypothetical protein
MHAQLGSHVNDAHQNHILSSPCTLLYTAPLLANTGTYRSFQHHRCPSSCASRHLVLLQRRCWYWRGRRRSNWSGRRREEGGDRFLKRMAQKLVQQEKRWCWSRRVSSNTGGRVRWLHRWVSSRLETRKHHLTFKELIAVSGLGGPT